MATHAARTATITSLAGAGPRAQTTNAPRHYSEEGRSQMCLGPMCRIAVGGGRSLKVQGPRPEQYWLLDARRLCATQSGADVPTMINLCPNNAQPLRSLNQRR